MANDDHMNGPVLYCFTTWSQYPMQTAQATSKYLSESIQPAVAYLLCSQTCCMCIVFVAGTSNTMDITGMNKESQNANYAHFGTGRRLHCVYMCYGVQMRI